MQIFLKKMVELFANSGDPDQTPRCAASDLCLHCLPSTRLRVSSFRWVNDRFHLSFFVTINVSSVTGFHHH